MSTALPAHRKVLADACAHAGLNDAGAQVIRVGENAIFRLPGRVAAAAKEVQIARWLARHDIPAIRALDGVQQPLEITGRGFELLRDIRELHMTCYLAQHAAEHPCARSEAELRVACLRGNHGPRPWNWTPDL